jgi:DNA-binding response OmpR family regulator
MGRRVAVVDDDRDIRDGLKMALTDEGYDVTVVPNGLRLLSALQVDRPDLIVLDVMMSWIDGFELCRAMKRNPDYSQIPVLFVSAKSSPNDI